MSSTSSSPAGALARLLDAVRARQARNLWLQGVLFGVAGATCVALLGAAMGSFSPPAGRLLLQAAPVLGVGVVLLFGLWRGRQLVGDAQATARLVAERVPQLRSDALASVELAQALSQGAPPFSAQLAQAFLAQVDAGAGQVDLGRVVDGRDVRAAAWVLAAVVGLGLAALGLKGEQLRAGVAAALAEKPAAALARRTPITGDVELTYRYPAYTGLVPRTVTGTTGEISAPAGTEVGFKARADRDLEAAVLVVNGARVPLQRSGRELSGTLQLKEPGQYHVAFLDGQALDLEGPDLPIRIEVDAVPEVKLLAPEQTVELDPDQSTLRLKYEASDDYGLAALELVYRLPDGKEARVALGVDDGRTTRGEYSWEVGGLQLAPGQEASYFVEARDTNTVAGPQTGVSRTHTVKVYSAAEHRREAVAKAEALWEGLVLHLADRMEGGDRDPTATLDALVRNAAIDERADTLAGQMKGLAEELLEQRDAPVELAAALSNVSSGLSKDGRFVRDVRRVVGRLSLSGSEFLRDARRRLSIAAAQDVKSSEQNVLYLEALLDRQKLQALKDLADQLKQERRELSKLLETLKGATEEDKKAALLKQASALRERIQELMQRMAELSKGIRDEHLNEEALAELAEQENLGAQLDDIEKLVREGKTEEAMAKLQELGMQMDQMLEGIDKAAQESDAQANPELAEKFKDFTEALERTVKEQEKVAQETKELRDRYRGQLKDRVSKQGDSLKGELLRKTAELKEAFKKLDPESLGSRAGEAQNDGLQQLDGLEGALQSDDYSLAAEAAQRLEQRAQELEGVAAELRRRDELFQRQPEARKASRELAERTKKSADTAAEISQKLQNLFPPSGSMLSERDRQKLKELSGAQQGLEQRTEQLQQMMDGIGELAPVFNDDAKRQLDQAGQKMDQAGQRLEGRDVGRATGEQQAALEGLKGLQQQLQQQMQQGGGKGGGLPMPMLAQGNGKGNGRGKNSEKVEIPDEDPNGAPLNFRKDVMDAMKQGGPERYKDQVKRYYEELVK